MNVLSLGERVRVVSALVEGTSLRATHRITDTSRKAIARLVLDLGDGCTRLLDGMMRDLHCDVLELDEIWSFVRKKEGHRNEGDPEDWGDQYTWTALDARTKLIPVHLVAKRTTEAALTFATDLRARVVGAPQITTDGLKAYIDAIEMTFGSRVHYAQILKTYAADEAGGASRDDVRYSRGRVIRSVKRTISGRPVNENISTSMVERSNLTMRQQQKRWARLTLGHSKKLAQHRAAAALHFAHYNLVRVHQTLRVTPAVEAGVTDRVWSLGELVEAALAASAPEPLPPVTLGSPNRARASSGRPSGAAALPGQLRLPGVW